MITSKTFKALSIIANRDYSNPITANEFARAVWPDSDAWNRIYNTGNGATRGKGLWLSAGGYLAKLYTRHLISHDVLSSQRVWRISSEGKKAMEEYEKSGVIT